MFTGDNANYIAVSPTLAIWRGSVPDEGPLPREIIIAVWPEGRDKKNTAPVWLDPIDVANLPFATDADKATLAAILTDLVAERGLMPVAD